MDANFQFDRNSDFLLAKYLNLMKSFKSSENVNFHRCMFEVLDAFPWTQTEKYIPGYRFGNELTGCIVTHAHNEWECRSSEKDD